MTRRIAIAVAGLAVLLILGACDPLPPSDLAAEDGWAGTGVYSPNQSETGNLQLTFDEVAETYELVWKADLGTQKYLTTSGTFTSEGGTLTLTCDSAEWGVSASTDMPYSEINLERAELDGVVPLEGESSAFTGETGLLGATLDLTHEESGTVLSFMNL